MRGTKVTLLYTVDEKTPYKQVQRHKKKWYEIVPQRRDTSSRETTVDTFTGRFEVEKTSGKSVERTVLAFRKAT